MFLSLRLAALTVLFISHVYGLVIPLDKRDQLCNGHAELCDRKYGNTTFLGAHDSFAASGNFFAFARTQEVDVQTQLMMGVRMLQAQAHMNREDLHFCHTSCSLFDGGKVLDYLAKVKHFLDRHPNEIITLILANPESVSTALWAPIFESSGLANMSYVPPQASMTRDTWPTLKEMLDAGQRLVVFMDKGAEDGSVPYILPQFNNMWEDVYDPTDPEFPCSVDRVSSSVDPSQLLNLANHNLNFEIFPAKRGFRIPFFFKAPKTNSISSIMQHGDHCAPLVNGNRPNFVLVDFVDIGQAVTAVAQLNGFPY